MSAVKLEHQSLLAMNPMQNSDSKSHINIFILFISSEQSFCLQPALLSHKRSLRADAVISQHLLISPMLQIFNFFVRLSHAYFSLIAFLPTVRFSEKKTLSDFLGRKAVSADRKGSFSIRAYALICSVLRAYIR
jgi:hypothetical protein